MSTPILGIEYFYNLATKTWDAFGRPSLPAAPTFIDGETMPTLLNSGVAPEELLDPYAADITTPRTIIVTTAGTVFENVDFGNIRVDVRAANVVFRNCRWIVTNNRTTTPMIGTDLIVAGGKCLVERCTIDNRDQLGYQYNAIQGHDITVYRCKILGTVDGIRPNRGGNVRILCNFIGYLGWWGTFTGGPALNSGLQTHSDCIQTTYAGVVIEGNTLVAYPSTIVGTGTPGSGSDTGTPGAWYTQAAAEARRAQAFTKTISGSLTWDGLAHESGGILTPLMCNVATGPTSLDLVVRKNWWAGGQLHVNALATNLTTSVGTFEGNRHYNDTFYTVAGRAIGYRLRTDTAYPTLDAVIPQVAPNYNTWVDTGGVVAKN